MSSLFLRKLCLRPLNLYFRFLATGETYTSLASQYRVGVTTMSRIIPEVCSAIWETMQDTYMKMPQTEDEWKEISREFTEKWNYPHCVGAIDGKHIVIKAPINSGSLYFNYKSSFSIVLMAISDACNRFIWVDIGAFGRQSDAGVFANSNMAAALATPHNLHLPDSEPIPGSEHLGPMPYVFVGDEAFPLQLHLMRPYPGRQSTQEKKAYNYRHSRARRIVECAFGLLAARWRVFQSKMAIKPSNVIKVVQGTLILHKMLQTDSNPSPSVDELVEDYRIYHAQGFGDLAHTGNNRSAEAASARQKFCQYFQEKPLSWQMAHVQRGLY